MKVTDTEKQLIFSIRMSKMFIMSHFKEFLLENQINSSQLYDRLRTYIYSLEGQAGPDFTLIERVAAI